MSGTRSRSRSPVRRGADEPYEIDSSQEDTDDDPRPSFDCRKFKIENFPLWWTHKDVKQFIKDRTNSSVISDAIKYVSCKKNKRPATSVVEFSDPNVCRQAYSQLKARKHEKCDGRYINITWECENQFKPEINRNNNSNNNNSKGTRNRDRKQATFKPSATQMSLDTYGLSSAFLESLGVKLPLLNKIFVANLEKQVDEDKLREIFGHAGQIVDVFIIHKDNKPKMAKIEYDHPLEAVQAISMFHNQDLFGRILAVQMDNSPTLRNKPLPEGLASIGPGLGPNGEAMRAIRFVAELQPLKELIHREITKLKGMINPTEHSINSMNQSDTGMSMLNSMTPLNINTLNPVNQAVLPVPNPFVNTQSTQNFQFLQGLLQQNVGSDLTSSLTALQAQTMAPNLVGFAQSYGAGQDWNSQGLNMGGQSSLSSDIGGSIKNSGFDKRSRKSEDNDRSMTTSDMVVFNNLPKSVTLPTLKTKMREVGDLKFIEITEEGKAIVRFHSAQDAERCVKLFDRSKVDGQLIHVRFF